MARKGYLNAHDKEHIVTSSGIKVYFDTLKENKHVSKETRRCSRYISEWLDKLLVYLEANRNYLYEYVEKELPGISMVKPEGTYLAWMDCREAIIDDNPCEFFLNNARVALNDGITFGKGGEGFVRLNFGCPRSMLTEALQRMRGALQG